MLLAVALSCANKPIIEEGYVDCNGATLFYKTMGRGDPVVVLHGGPGFDHRQFLPFIWELASDHKIILFDQRGTGLSSCPIDSASINIDTFIDDIEAIREAFQIEKMNLLGHSWGGILAMHYGIRHSDHLKSLIICSAAASADSFKEMRENYEADRLPGDREKLNEIASSPEFQNDEPEAIERFWRVYFKPYFVDQSLVSRMDLVFSENTIRNSNAVAGYIMQSIGAFDLHDDLQAIRCPTLIIHGESDPMPCRYAEQIQERIAGSELVIAEDSGHWIFIDATDIFSSSILDFLARAQMCN